MRTLSFYTCCDFNTVIKCPSSAPWTSINTGKSFRFDVVNQPLGDVVQQTQMNLFKLFPPSSGCDGSSVLCLCRLKCYHSTVLAGRQSNLEPGSKLVSTLSLPPVGRHRLAARNMSARTCSDHEAHHVILNPPPPPLLTLWSCTTVPQPWPSAPRQMVSPCLASSMKFTCFCSPTEDEEREQKRIARAKHSPVRSGPVRIATICSGRAGRLRATDADEFSLERTLLSAVLCSSLPLFEWPCDENYATRACTPGRKAIASGCRCPRTHWLEHKSIYTTAPVCMLGVR